MTDDLDRVGPKGPIVTRTDEVSRRDFLARGGALTGGTVAAPALLGIGTTLAPLTARAREYSKIFRFNNKRLPSPFWERFQDILNNAGVTGIDTVDVEWNQLPTDLKGGKYVGRVRYFQNALRTSHIVREYTFSLSYFYNARSKIDIIPQSIEITDVKKGIISPKIPSDIQHLALGAEEDGLASLPKRWFQVLWWFRTQKVNGLNIYKVEEIKNGFRALGLARQVWTVWQTRTPEGAELAAPKFLGSYTVFKGFVGHEWTTIYVPTVTSAMNGLVNNFDGGLVLAIALGGGLLATMPVLITTLGRGIVAASTHAALDESFVREYSPAFDAIIGGAVFAGGSAILAFYARQYGIMRGRSAMMGFMSQCVYPHMNSATQANPPSAWVDKQAVPYAGWEPAASKPTGQ
jgi:hypothetical protein